MKQFKEYKTETLGSTIMLTEYENIIDISLKGFLKIASNFSIKVKKTGTKYTLSSPTINGTMVYEIGDKKLYTNLIASEIQRLIKGQNIFNT